MKTIFKFIFLFLLCFAPLVVGIDFATNPNTWTNSRYTAYYKTCVDFKSNPYDCKIGFFFSQTTYLALPERQSVVRTSPMFVVVRIDNCEVLDSKNWYCKTGGTNEEPLLMEDGNIHDLGDERKNGKLPVTQQIPHIEYLTRFLFHDEDEAFKNNLALHGLGPQALKPNAPKTDSNP